MICLQRVEGNPKRSYMETRQIDGMILPTMVADEKISTKMLPPGLPLPTPGQESEHRSDGAFNLAWWGLQTMGINCRRGSPPRREKEMQLCSMLRAGG